EGLPPPPRPSAASQSESSRGPRPSQSRRRRGRSARRYEDRGGRSRSLPCATIETRSMRRGSTEPDIRPVSACVRSPWRASSLLHDREPVERHSQTALDRVLVNLGGERDVLQAGPDRFEQG